MSQTLTIPRSLSSRRPCAPPDLAPQIEILSSVPMILLAWLARPHNGTSRAREPRRDSKRECYPFAVKEGHREKLPTRPFSPATRMRADPGPQRPRSCDLDMSKSRYGGPFQSPQICRQCVGLVLVLGRCMSNSNARRPCAPRATVRRLRPTPSLIRVCVGRGERSNE
jgi:hypothetical protein